jgi:hypothetical protein
MMNYLLHITMWKVFRSVLEIVALLRASYT